LNILIYDIIHKSIENISEKRFYKESLKVTYKLGTSGSHLSPSYSGGRDQEDLGLKPAWANSYMRSYLKKHFTKIGLVEWLKVQALSSNSRTAKKKRERERESNIYKNV
jgi:hypothetical protein